MKKELAQGRVTLVATDLSKAAAEEKQLRRFDHEGRRADREALREAAGSHGSPREASRRRLGEPSALLPQPGPEVRGARRRRTIPRCSAIPRTQPKGKLSGPLPGRPPREARSSATTSQKPEATDKDKLLMIPSPSSSKDDKDEARQGRAVSRGVARRTSTRSRSELKARRRGARRRRSPRSRRICSRQRRRSPTTSGGPPTRPGRRWTRRTRSSTSASRRTRSTTSPAARRRSTT